jgi:hypothetical protein
LWRRWRGILITQRAGYVLSGEQSREFLIIETRQAEVKVQTLEVDQLNGQ